MKQAPLKLLCLLLAGILLLGSLPVAFAASMDAGQIDPVGGDPPDTGSVEATGETETAPPEEEIQPQEPESPKPPIFPDEIIGYVQPDSDIPTSGTTGTLTRSSSLNGKYYFWGSEMKTYTFRYADGTSITTSLGGMCIHYVNGKVAYCLQPEVGSAHNTTYSGTDAEQSSYWNSKLTAAQRDAISLIILYGAPNCLFSTDKDTEFGYEGATQILIWEIVMGLRSPAAPYTRNSSKLYSTFQGNSTFPSLDVGYAKIVEALQSHMGIPSFASSDKSKAPTVRLQYDVASGLYKASVTDTNGVLSGYDFAAAGITLSRSGNTLQISAPLSAVQNGSVLASAKGKSLNAGSVAHMIWTASGLQTVSTFTASPEPVTAYFQIQAALPPGTATLRKTASTGPVDGYCFKMWQATGNKTYYGKSDSDGNIYMTDSSYTASGKRTYTFTGLMDGEFSFREALSASDHKNSHPTAWRFVVTDRNGKTTVDRTLTESEIIADGADFITPRIQLTGLTGGGKLSMTITNAPNTTELELVKKSTDGKVAGIEFLLEEWVPGIGYCKIGKYTTDGNGKITIPDRTISTKYRVTELVPEGYVCEKNPQEITLKETENAVTFQNHPIVGRIELTKIDEFSQSTKLSGAEFTVTMEYPADNTSLGSALATVVMQEQNGLYYLNDIPYGTLCTIRETKAPEGYKLSEETFTVTILEEKTYTVSSKNFPCVVNREQLGSIQVKKVDTEGTPLSGVSFLLEYSVDGKVWKPVTNRKEAYPATVGSSTSAALQDGVLVTGEDGTVSFTGLALQTSKRFLQYRLTEIATQPGLTLMTEPVFEGSLVYGENPDITLTAVNGGQFLMPFTGGSGNMLFSFGSLLLTLALLGFSLLWKRRNNQSCTHYN